MLQSSKKQEQSEDFRGGSEDNEEPFPLRKLIIHKPLVISISNYILLAFLSIAVFALLPLFCAMPLEIGGLDLDPPKIGYIIGSYGAASAIFQLMFFSRIVHYLGAGKSFVMSMSTLIPIFLLFPVINTAAVAFGMQSPLVWALIAILISCAIVSDMSYGVFWARSIIFPFTDFVLLGLIFMFVTASAPNKGSLGATNGLAQSVVSIARAIGPAFSTSLFSFSVQHKILRGFGVYAFLLVLSIGAVFLATRLPSKLWDEEDEASR